MFRRTFLASLAMIAAVAAAEPAFAQRGRDRDNNNNNDNRPFDFQFQRGPGQSWDAPQQREVPLSSIVRDIGRQYGGRQIDSTRRGDRWIIGWITQDGRKLTIEADAITGRILSTR
jgi:hypothetical protein